MKLPLCLLLTAVTALADDSAKLASLLAQGGVVTIPAGDYQLDGTKPIPLLSHTTVMAHGARFILPETLPDQARVVLFAGENIEHFAWHGGEFIGHVFDPAKKDNTWEPNANTKGIEITTTRAGGTHDLLFRDVKSNGMAAAVIGVHGQYGKKSESEVEHYAERVAIESCTLLRSGKFMWDYGYLWQIMTWPEAYEPWEVERAKKYFRTDLMREIAMSAGDDRVRLDNTVKPIAVSQSDEPKGALTFLGDALPKNVVRGRQYFVIEAAPDFIKIADQPGGEAIQFDSAGTGHLAFNISATYLSAYAPTGSGPGKGAFDIVGAKDVRVTACQLSAIARYDAHPALQEHRFRQQPHPWQPHGRILSRGVLRECHHHRQSRRWHQRQPRHQRREELHGCHHDWQHLPQRRTRCVDQSASELHHDWQCVRQQHDQK